VTWSYGRAISTDAFDERDSELLLLLLLLLPTLGENAETRQFSRCASPSHT
jgi:hypothetical protein